VPSLDAPLGSLSQDDEVTSLSELLEDHTAPGPVEQAEQQELTEMLSTAIEALPEREKLLLALYYQEELTMKEISKILNVSESRVCQLHMQAVMRLRSSLSAYRSGEVSGNKEGEGRESKEKEAGASPKENKRKRAVRNAGVLEEDQKVSAVHTTGKYA
jgi:RNA polymerase sigma factor for flagellar operon FliA